MGSVQKGEKIDATSGTDRHLYTNSPQLPLADDCLALECWVSNYSISLFQYDLLSIPTDTLESKQSVNFPKAHFFDRRLARHLHYADYLIRN